MMMVGRFLVRFSSILLESWLVSMMMLFMCCVSRVLMVLCLLFLC